MNDYYHIHQREGEKFAILFNYISKIFIQYYTKSKGNKPKNQVNEQKTEKTFFSKEATKLNKDEIKLVKPVFKSFKLKKLGLKGKKIKVYEVNLKNTHQIFDIRKVQRESDEMMVGSEDLK